MISLKGILPDKAVEAIDQLVRTVSSLQAKLADLQSKPLLTKPQADAAYGPAAQIKALQVSGSNPLNCTGLLGTGITKVNTTLPLTGGGSGGTVNLGVNVATSSSTGVVKPDNTTITVSGGVISAAGGGGTVTSVGLTVPSGFTVSGSPVTTSGTLAVSGILNVSAGGTGTASPGLIAGSNVAISGTWPDQTISVSGGGSGSLINSGELIAQVAPPALASWTQLNTPTSASDVTGIGVLLNTAATGINVKGLLIAAPGVPFTVTIRIVGQFVGANFAQFGLCLAAGTTASDKLVNFGYTINSAPRHEIAYYTNATSYSSSPLSPSVLYTARYVNGYLRVQDNGTNLLFSVSDTGLPGTFVQIFSASRTAWLPSGPAYIGFETNEYNSGWPVTAVLTHWVVTTP